IARSSGEHFGLRVRASRCQRSFSLFQTRIGSADGIGERILARVGKSAARLRAHWPGVGGREPGLPAGIGFVRAGARMWRRLRIIFLRPATCGIAPASPPRAAGSALSRITRLCQETDGGTALELALPEPG